MIGLDLTSSTLHTLTLRQKTGLLNTIRSFRGPEDFLLSDLGSLRTTGFGLGRPSFSRYIDARHSSYEQDAICG